LQYKRDDGVYDNHLNNNNSNSNGNNNNNNQLAYFNNRYERRLSVESVRTLSDSSSESEGKTLIENFKMLLLNHFSNFLAVVRHKDGKRRRNNIHNISKNSIEQCEKEIHRLQSSVDILRQKLEESELKETSDSIEAIARQSDNKIRSIITR
jgi:RAS protein activator-like 2